MKQTLSFLAVFITCACSVGYTQSQLEMAKMERTFSIQRIEILEIECEQLQRDIKELSAASVANSDAITSTSKSVILLSGSIK